MITKEQVEKDIKAVDACVKELAGVKGLFSYESQALIRNWNDTRQSIARCAVNYLNADKKTMKTKGKQVVRSYNDMSFGDDNTDKAIVLEKSKKKTFFIKLKNLVTKTKGE